ncbi:hypothetical protein L2E82_14296 [Cichorium intybus]|uniref:Uncharacterized protein n=1 Tax=Cichorium intybus TaxID=13427 RepID=A0ACB9EZ21_CICIN|nr:hypothetical protein L2E82_14296 [Cichorium intybus]
MRNLQRGILFKSCLSIQNKRFTSAIIQSSASRSLKIVCQAATNVSRDVPASASTSSEMTTYERIIETLTTLFPLWVILGTIIGIYKPSAVSIPLNLTWLETDLFTVGLGFLMLSMGLTLTFEDFKCIQQEPATGLNQTIDELRELLEDCHPLMSKVNFVMQVESLFAKLRSQSLELF